MLTNHRARIPAWQHTLAAEFTCVGRGLHGGGQHSDGWRRKPGHVAGRTQWRRTQPRGRGGEAGRQRLFEALERTHARGGRVAFDTNFRPRGWPERTVAQATYRRAFGCADFVLASTEDLELLFGSARPSCWRA